METAECPPGSQVIQTALAKKRFNHVHGASAKGKARRQAGKRTGHIHAAAALERQMRKDLKHAPAELCEDEAAAVMPGRDVEHFVCLLCADRSNIPKTSAKRHFANQHEQRDTKKWVVVKDGAFCRRNEQYRCLLESYVCDLTPQHSDVESDSGGRAPGAAAAAAASSGYRDGEAELPCKTERL